MKKTLFAIFAVLAFASCESDGYKIVGSFPSAEDGSVVYLTADDDFYTTLDSAVITNGKFTFAGGYHDRAVRMLLVPGKAIGGPVVVEKGVVEVEFDKSSMKRGGTDGNQILQRFVEASERLKGLEEVTSPAFLKAMPMDKSVYDSIVVVRDTERRALTAYAYLAIEKNIDNGLGLYIITKSYKMLSASLLAPLMERVPGFLRNKRYNVVNNYVAVSLECEKQKVATAVGKEYLNFELPDYNDKNVLFSSVVSRNKYTLLQFWAGWCAPCRVELPEISKLCGKYGKMGFAAVGVSLDSTLEEWKAAVSSLKPSWLQLCKPMGGSAEVAAAYGVSSVPSNILINNKGVIIARDVTPSELDSLLKESLK